MDLATPVPAIHDLEDEALDQLLRQVITGYFVLTDGQGALSKWSDPAEFLFGMPAEEALGQPFFGRIVDQAGLDPVAESWRAFLELGEVPGTRGSVEVAAAQPGGGTFPMETVFVPVKLDEGFDFSLFLEDLSFELPLDMMLLRMRQQHPVVIRALRAALSGEQQPWEGWRTAGTLVAFRPLVPTPWVEEGIARRAAELAAAEAELQSRIAAYETPEVQGSDVYDLEDARAVIDRLRWATERIEDLEERSRIAESAAAQAASAHSRAEAAERAALDAAAAMADRPADPSAEAEREQLDARLQAIELIIREQFPGRVDALERALRDGAADHRAAAEVAAVEAQAAVERARAELVARADEALRLAAEAQQCAADAGERINLVDRGAATVLDEVRASRAALEEAGGLARAAQDRAGAAEGRLDELSGAVAGAFERLEGLTHELGSLREHAGGAGLAAEERLGSDIAQTRESLEDLRGEVAWLRSDGVDALRGEVAALRSEGVDALRGEVAALRSDGLDALRGEIESIRHDGLDALGGEIASLREELAAVRDAEPSRDDAQALEELRDEVRSALASIADLKQGFEEARQAAVAARRDAETARATVEKVSAVTEATTEKFATVWQTLLGGGGQRHSAPHAAEAQDRPRPVRPAVSKPRREAPPERAPREGFDDQARPMALLDLKGRFKELNPAFTKLVGYREHEFGKATWPSVLDRGMYKHQAEELGRLVAGEIEFAEVRSTYMHGQGLMVPVVGEVQLQRAADGTPEALLIVADAGHPSNS